MKKLDFLDSVLGLLGYAAIAIVVAGVFLGNDMLLYLWLAIAAVLFIGSVFVQMFRGPSKAKEKSDSPA